MIESPLYLPDFDLDEDILVSGSADCSTKVRYGTYLGFYSIFLVLGAVCVVDSERIRIQSESWSRANPDLELIWIQSESGSAFFYLNADPGPILDLPWNCRKK